MAESDQGDDFGGVEDLDPTMAVVSGRRCTAECVARRWLDLPGSLFYAPDLGAGLEGFLGASMLAPGDISTLLEAEALKDERVDACSVLVTSADEQLVIKGTLTDKDGPFDLTVLVSSLDSKVLMENVR